jgi:hypothetical protein
MMLTLYVLADKQPLCFNRREEKQLSSIVFQAFRFLGTLCTRGRSLSSNLPNSNSPTEGEEMLRHFVAKPMGDPPHIGDGNEMRQHSFQAFKGTLCARLGI